MGRGRSSSGGGGSRGMSSSSSFGGGSRHTTIIIGGGRHYHSHGKATKSAYIIASFFFLMFGLFLILGLIAMVNEVNSFAPVQGTCVKNERVNGWYYTTYEYTVNGIDYRERSNEGWEFEEELGEVVTIYYEKDNPKNIQETKPELGDAWIAAVLAVVFTSVGVWLLVKGVKMKNDQEATVNKAPAIDNIPNNDGYTTCSYCGSKYKKELDSCPKCGGR